jgi:poly(hydroxyalkanoate) granule-associated protein
MVKKLKKMAEQQKNASGAGLLDSQLAQSVRDSAQQIWLAGMGAFAKAQQEGGKVFESLVKEGASLQRKTQAVAEERIGDVATRMTAMAEGVSAKAGQQWDKLETIFEQRVSKALGKLGVPSSQDVDALVSRIDALAAEVSKLTKSPRSAKGSATRANGTAQPAARPAGKAAAKRAPRKGASA